MAAAGHEKAARRRPVAGQEELGAALLALLLEQHLGLGPLEVQRDGVGCPAGQFVGPEVERFDGYHCLVHRSAKGMLSAFSCGEATNAKSQTPETTKPALGGPWGDPCGSNWSERLRQNIPL